MNIYDVFPEDLLAGVAAKLKERPGVEPPKESQFWKTGWFKEFPPDDPKEFWYVRAASIMRKIYRGPIGVNHLKKAYGGRDPGHMRLAHSARGSGAIIRRILQQLEKAGLVATAEKKGRILTKEGRSLLDKVAAEIVKAEQKKV
jgi:small subunit ribosomal protein S19e